MADSTTIIAVFEGSHTIRLRDDPTFSFTSRRGGIVGQFCTKLLQAGHPPETLLKIIRENADGSTTTCFDARSLLKWAGKRLYEQDKAGFVVKKCDPFTGPDKSQLAAVREYGR